MKALVFLLAILAVAHATTLAVVTPWGTTTWIAGGIGDITWTVSPGGGQPDFTNCHIDLLGGEFTNANLVAHVTNPATPVACSAQKYQITPIGDFSTGKYWIRIGNAPDGPWFYSAAFQLTGNGSQRPLQLAWNASQSVGPIASTANGKAASASFPATASAKATSSKLNASASAASASGSDSTSLRLRDLGFAGLVAALVMAVVA